MNSFARLARRVAALQRSVDAAPVMRQGVVAATSAGPPRTVDVAVAEGTIPAVRLSTHHAMPAVGSTVWILWVGPMRWLYWGQLG